jgi:hypothetical protein
MPDMLPNVLNQLGQDGELDMVTRRNIECALRE